MIIYRNDPFIQISEVPNTTIYRYGMFIQNAEVSNTTIYMRGGWKIPRLYALSQKLFNIFQRFFFLFQSIPTYVYTVLPASQELLHSLCKPWSRPLPRNQFTAEIKAALVSYLFPASFFFSSGNKQKLQWGGMGGGGWGGGGGERKWINKGNKGNDKHEDANSLLYNIMTYSMYVPNFVILGRVVPEKFWREKSLHTDKHCYRKDKDYIPPI